MNKSFSIRNYFLLMMVMAVLCFITILPSAITAWQVNRWSLGFTNEFLAKDFGNTPYDLVPPQAHRRATLWLSREALEMGLPERALALLNPILKNQTRDVLWVQGEAFFEMGDIEGAIGAWEKARDYQSLIKAGNLAETKGLFDTAELAYLSGWKVNPVAGILPLVNFMWQIQGDPVSAEQILRVSLSSYDPKNLDWLRSLGLILQTQLRWDDAISVYQEALDQRPDDLYSLNLIGHAYLIGKNDYARAQNIFEHMISLAPSNGGGYFGMGELSAMEGEIEKADEWYVKALDRSPEKCWWWLTRANNQRNAGNISKALDLYLETIEHFPGSENAYYELSWGYKLNNQSIEAIKSIERAIKINSIEDRFYWRAGMIYEWAGMSKEALASYENSYLLSPTNEEFEIAIERLKSLDELP